MSFSQFSSVQFSSALLCSLQLSDEQAPLRLLFTLHSATHAPRTSFPRLRPVPHAPQGMPVSSRSSAQSHWCSADHHADVAAHLSICRLVSGVLSDWEPSRQSRLSTEFFFSFLPSRAQRQNRTEQTRTEPDWENNPAVHPDWLSDGAFVPVWLWAKQQLASCWGLFEVR